MALFSSLDRALVLMLSGIGDFIEATQALFIASSMNSTVRADFSYAAMESSYMPELDQCIILIVVCSCFFQSATCLPRAVVALHDWEVSRRGPLSLIFIIFLSFFFFYMMFFVMRLNSHADAMR